MRFYFESYGCTMNKGEAGIMEDILRENGHDIASDINNADALVLVTCTVIETTELKMLKRLRTFSETGKPLVVAGCMASVQKQQILDLNPDAVILHPLDIDIIDKIVDSLPVIPTKDRDIIHAVTTPSKTADAIIPISSGCIGCCTYCITRIARGELKSTPPDSLIENMKKALASGNKEIRLSAQDTASYGLDIDSNLPNLLGDILAIEGDFRVRVGMMNPDTLIPILPKLIESFKDKRMYKFLHLPVQSGSEEILKRMGRQYSTEEFFNVITEFKDIHPGLTISTDIIVGFPGETDEDFDLSMNLVKRLRPNILNITRFSSRPETLAREMKDQIPSRIAKDRSRELSRVHIEISLELNKSFVGSNERILVTGYGKNNTMMGRTDSYLPVVIEENVDICKFVDVTITEAQDTYLKGRVI
jgi:MiaB-like tRNA modifying enzyme